MTAVRAAGHRRATARFLRWWDGVMAEVHDPAARPLAERPPDELIALYRRVWAEVSARWGVTLANTVYGLLVMRAGTALLRRWSARAPSCSSACCAGAARTARSPPHAPPSPSPNLPPRYRT